MKSNILGCVFITTKEKVLFLSIVSPIEGEKDNETFISSTNYTEFIEKIESFFEEFQGNCRKLQRLKVKNETTTEELPRHIRIKINMLVARLNKKNSAYVV